MKLSTVFIDDILWGIKTDNTEKYNGWPFLRVDVIILTNMSIITLQPKGYSDGY